MSRLLAGQINPIDRGPTKYRAASMCARAEEPAGAWRSSETKPQRDLRPAGIGAIREATRGGTGAHAWQRPQDPSRGLIRLGRDRRVAHPIEDVECFEIQIQTVAIGEAELLRDPRVGPVVVSTGMLDWGKNGTRLEPPNPFSVVVNAAPGN